MNRSALVLLAVSLFGVPLATPSQVEAQLDRVARRAAERELERKVAGIARDAVRCALGDKVCFDKAAEDGKPVVVTDADGEIITDEQGKAITDPEEAERRTQQPGEGVWDNYDYVPGRRPLRVISFENEPVGRFPASQLVHVRGNAQTVVRNDENWLEATNTIVRIELPESTGESFSIEMGLRVPTANIGVTLHFAPLEGALRRNPNDYVHISARPGIYRAGNEVSGSYMPGIVGRDVRAKLQVDSGSAILYIDSDRIAQVPVANFPDTRVLELHMAGNPRFPTYLYDVVVAVGLDDLYDALVNTGAYTTRGIFFDTDSDRIRPESTRVLTDLLDALNRADTMSVAIIGHTDDQGEADYNQQLSERRAAAVVAYLTAQGIAADRLSAQGRGEAEPASPNTTPEGRQENRRVEIRVVQP
jgi:outer membrane protein OmpA-like peptidoglycan-associated protein